MGFERNENRVFDYNKNGELAVDDLLLSDIGDQFGTPLYVYSANAIIESYNNFQNAIKGVNGQIHFAVKANSNLAILRLLADLGSGADIVSIGEMHRALRAGIAPEKIIFSGVGKTDADIKEAIELRVGQINAESPAEIDAIVRVSNAIEKGCRVALRLNLDVEAKTHKKMATGSHDTKFGMTNTESSWAALYDQIKSSEYLEQGGLAIHIGSQIMDFDGYDTAWRRLKGLGEFLRKKGYAVPSLDLGGGFGIDYRTGKTINLARLSSLLEDIFGDDSFALGFEPGRFLVAEAGALLTKVIYTKISYDKNYVIVDGAMNDLIRPTLYDAYHRIEAVKSPPENMFGADIVGPICETGDFFGHNRELAEVSSGDYLAVLSAGAYGAVMRSSYNTRPPAAEVLVLNGKAHRISKRITYRGLLNQDIIPPVLAQAEKT